MRILLPVNHRIASMPKPAAPVLAGWIMALLLISASVAKLISFRQFEATLATSRLLPQFLIPVVATALVSAEGFAAVAILTPKIRDVGLLTAGILCSMFVTYSVWRWSQGINAPCGCFAALFRLSPAADLGIDAAGIALLVTAAHDNGTLLRPRIVESSTQQS